MNTMKQPVITIVSILILILAALPPAVGAGELKQITLKGSYFDIGEAWGRAAKTAIETGITNELAGLAKYFSLKDQDLIAFSGKYLPLAEAYDPEFILVLKGMAKGSGIDFHTLFAGRALLELMFYVHKIPAMCTSFAVTGEATQDGQTIIGQTIDWHDGIPMALLRISWPNGVEQLSLSMGGLWEYPLSAHPSSPPFGLASTLTVSMSDTQDIRQVPVSLVIQKASRQKRLEMALSTFINTRQNMASFVLANSEGEMAGVELAINQYEVLLPEKDMICHSNHYLSDRFKPVDFFGPFVPDSYLRYHRMKRLIRMDHGKITPALMMQKLADHNNHPKSICAHVDPDSPFPPSKTLAAVIMVPAEKTVYIAPGNPCDTEFQKYELN